jgi:hypothetical protein
MNEPMFRDKSDPDWKKSDRYIMDPAGQKGVKTGLLKVMNIGSKQVFIAPKDRFEFTGESYTPPAPVQNEKPKHRRSSLTPEQKEDNRKKKAKSHAEGMLAKLLASPDAASVSEALFEHGITPSRYSYHAGTKARAEEIANNYGTSLGELAKYGLSHCDDTPVGERNKGKAQRPKGTAATFKMEVMTEAQRSHLDNLRSDFLTAIAQKENSSWGPKVTLNWDSFWFFHVLRLIRDGRIQLVDCELHEAI